MKITRSIGLNMIQGMLSIEATVLGVRNMLPTEMLSMCRRSITKYVHAHTRWYLTLGKSGGHKSGSYAKLPSMHDL